MDIILPKKRPIGIFDSGVGGLTVLKEVQKRFPNEDIIYYADTAHVPYGEKTCDQITLYSEIAVEWMIKHHDVKMIIIACHTSSVCCAGYLQKKYTIPIIDTIYATVQAVLDYTPASLTLLGTQRTIEQKVHEHALRKASYTGIIVSQICSGFVPLIEQGFIESIEIEQLVYDYCSDIKTTALVYGCTHYPFIEKVIQKVVGPAMLLINPATYIVLQMEDILRQESFVVKKGYVQFHVTGNKKSFYSFFSKSHFDLQSISYF